MSCSAGPLNRLVLAAGSVADDLGYVALADIAGVLGIRTTEYRVIGGQARVLRAVTRR